MCSMLSVASFLSYDTFTFINDQVVGLSLHIPLADTSQQEACDCVFVSNDGQ